MRRVFADSNYWVALLNPRDVLHDKAQVLSRQFDFTQIVTSEMVLAELLNCCGNAGAQLRQTAAESVRSLRDSSETKVVPQTSDLFERALERYRFRPDKTWGLTDCASFIIMEDEGLTIALTHDHHFIQAGFQALLR